MMFSRVLFRVPAHGVDRKHGIHDAASVKNGAEFVLLRPRLIAVIHLRDDILNRRKVGAWGVESQRLVARGGVASRHHVVLRAGPPDKSEEHTSDSSH